VRLYLRPKYREKIRFKEKLRVFSLVVAIGFGIFIARLAYLQLLSGAEFKNLSDRNRIRLLRLKAPRGLVYDRHQELLIDNRPSFTVSLIPAEASDPASVLAKLRRFHDFDGGEVLERVRNSIHTPFKQVLVMEDVSIDVAAAIEEYSFELPGIVISAEPCRRFPFDSWAAQVLGYPGEIAPEELERLAGRGYRIGDYIGKTGIESVAEHWLRGIDGGMQVQVYADARPQLELDDEGNPSVRIDTAGRRLITLGRRMPVAGNVVHLTLDAEMQRIAEEEMGEYAGTIIIMSADTGAIRAMVSRPSFNPNVFVSICENTQRADILNNPGHPLLNRAFQAYPPGSTFKIIVAYAALNEGIIDPQDRITCTGSFRLGRVFRCWKDHGHGSLNLEEALAFSCDVFFYTIGLELGIDRIEQYARAFGFGRPTDIELPGESSGLVPSAEWKKKNFRNPSDKKWYEGETLNTAIGQGYLLATPLQVAQAYATLANDGTLVRPYVIESVRTASNDAVLFKRNLSIERTLENTKALEIIREGLRQAVYARKPFYGTAWRAKNETIELMGKTGTAQVVGFKERAETPEELEKIPYKYRDHSWFAAIIESPEEPLVIVALCEHSGHASESAVPIVREIARRISINNAHMAAGRDNKEKSS
jgi:penicillin-binding protein 2